MMNETNQIILHTIQEYDVPKPSGLVEIPLASEASILTTYSTRKQTSKEDGMIAAQNKTSHVDDVISTSAGGDTAEDESSSEKWKRRKIVTLYFITISILYADMSLLAPNLSIIADEFGMDDDARDVYLGGLIALGFFFVGAPVSFLVGWLADSMNRSPLFAATVFVGELGCLLTTFVQNYWQLYVCR